MTKCLIMGGGGFIGSHLAERLLDKGYSIRVFDNFNFGTNNLNRIINDIELVNGDFLNESDVSAALKGVDYVFHYISTTVPATATKDPIFDIQTNLTGSVKLFQLAIKAGVKRLIFPSSGGTIYGDPIHLPVKETDALKPMDPYGISKLAIERYLEYFYRAYGMDYLILRYSNPYGERQNPHGQQGVIPVFLNKIKNDEQPTIYGDGTMERDYIYIGDAIEATIAAMESKASDRIFNVGSGEGTSIKALVDIMSDVIGYKIEPVYVQDNVVRVQKIVLSISRIEQQLGWKPSTSLKDGINKTWEWIKHSSFL
jgi:UDP-glucose 4-epimerase